MLWLSTPTIALDPPVELAQLPHIFNFLSFFEDLGVARTFTNHFHDTFTAKTSLTRVRVVPCYSFKVESLEGLNTMRPTIGIMPSSLPWVLKLVKGDDNLFNSLLTFRYKKRQPSDKLDDNLGYAKRYH
ncbi:hypothetical protein NC652_031896 [Populus alba x Populus x berolinensis]|nr:hypothetical protein NC652_031896 [Populus alba x Populus x berolinensis]